LSKIIDQYILNWNVPVYMLPAQTLGL